MADDPSYASQYNGGALLITIILFQVLTWVSVALRTYVRAVLTKSFLYDDWFMLVAQVWFRENRTLDGGRSLTLLRSTSLCHVLS